MVSMEQHPVPQAITSYEFRLVGEMTLKQFGKLAIGLGFAFIFYVAPLPSYVKWPLVLIFSGLGAAMAFIPIQGRPLEVWIVAFIKAIYSPTEYIYKKIPELPEFFRTSETTKISLARPALQPAPTRTKLDKYLGSLPSDKKMTAWEEGEKQFLSQVQAAFEKTVVPVNANLPKIDTKTPPTPRVAPPVIPPVPVKKPQPQPQTTVSPTMIQKAPLMLAPDQANIISGVIKNKENKLVGEALVEIKDNQNFPVRTLKSNSLGQFKITMPLENGIYHIEAEKEGLEFDTIKIKIEGKIIQPLEITAK